MSKTRLHLMVDQEQVDLLGLVSDATAAPTSAIMRRALDYYLRALAVFGRLPGPGRPGKDAVQAALCEMTQGPID